MKYPTSHHNLPQLRADLRPSSSRERDASSSAGVLPAWSTPNSGNSQMSNWMGAERRVGSSRKIFSARVLSPLNHSNKCGTRSLATGSRWMSIVLNSPTGRPRGLKMDAGVRGSSCASWLFPARTEKFCKCSRPGRRIRWDLFVGPRRLHDLAAKRRKRRKKPKNGQAEYSPMWCRPHHKP